jgi:hypothetical protein
MALIEKYLLKSKDLDGPDGTVVLMNAYNRLAESVYAAFNNDVTMSDNIAVQFWETSWRGDTYPQKVVDRTRIKGNPKGVVVLQATEDGAFYSMSNPAWSFEKETVKITDINGITTTKDYTATFLIL